MTLGWRWAFKLQRHDNVWMAPADVYSCFEKGCPQKYKSVRDNAERYSGKYPINFNESSESTMPWSYSEDLRWRAIWIPRSAFFYWNLLGIPRLPFGIVAYAFKLFWTTFVKTAVLPLLHPANRLHLPTFAAYHRSFSNKAQNANL